MRASCFALIAFVASHASAEEASSRAFIATEMGSSNNSSLAIDDRTHAAEGSNLYFGFRGGYSHGLGSAWSGVVSSRLATAATGWSEARSEPRVLFDLTVGPELRFLQSPRRPWSQIHVAMPVGIAMLQASPGPSRAVSSSDATGFGPTLGLDVGCDVAGLHHGATFGLSYALRLTWMERESHLVSDPDARVEQTERRLDHVFALSVGYLYRL